MVLQRSAKLLQAFVRNTQGNAAAAFVVSVLPVLVATGAAIDYGTATSARQQLDRAADVATMMGARAATGSDRKAIATSTFNSLAAAARNATVNSVAVSTPNAGTVKLQYTASVQTSLLSAAGIRTVDLAGDSVATSAQGGYADYYVLFDTSSSMGMGATQADSSRLISTIGCAFACHTPDSSSDDTYPRARAAGITMRIDVVRSSIINLIGTLQSSQAASGQFRVGLYPFVKKMKPLFALSSNLSAAMNAAQGIDLDSSWTEMGPGGTEVETPLSQLNAILPRSGDGSSAASPKIYVLLLTDGMNDGQTYNPSTKQWTNDANTPQRIHAFDPSACSPIKAKSITMGVLNVKYVPVTGPTFAAKQDQVANAAIPDTVAASQACASSSFYFDATYAAEIDAAFQSFAKATFSPTRFTQ